VPYGSFPAADGTIILAVGNDAQFARLVAEAGAPQLATDPDYATNAARVRHRDTLIPLLEGLTRQRPAADWLAAMDRLGIPAGPIHDLGQVFASPQVAARGMTVTLPHPTAAAGTVTLIGNPLKLSDTPVTYHRPPPTLGQDTRATLARLLHLSADDLDTLTGQGTIA